MCFIILQITTHISLSIFCFPSKIVCLLAFNSAFTNRRALFTSRCVFRFSIQSLPIKVRMIQSTTAVKLHTKSPILRFLKRSVIFSTVLFSFYHSLISLNNFSGIMYYENHYSAKIIQESNINKTIPIPIIHPMMNPFQKNSPLLFGIENKSFITSIFSSRL